MTEKRCCQVCNIEKIDKFCDNCKKETPSAYHTGLIETLKFTDSFADLGASLKRGEISWAYFPIAYGIILTIAIGIIQLIEPFLWYYRIGLIIVFAILLFQLCFFDSHFRNKIVGLFSKSKEHIEKF